MKETLIILAGMALVIGPAIFIGAFIAFIINRTIDYKTKKRKQNHPALFEMIEEANQIATKSCKFYNSMIVPKKKEIDRILKDWDYYPTEVRNQMEKELENLRQEVYNLGIDEKIMHSELNELRERIEEYKRVHGISWDC